MATILGGQPKTEIFEEDMSARFRSLKISVAGVVRAAAVLLTILRGIVLEEDGSALFLRQNSYPS